jgi:hypothetical protein
MPVPVPHRRREWDIPNEMGINMITGDGQSGSQRSSQRSKSSDIIQWFVIKFPIVQWHQMNPFIDLASGYA